MIVVALSLSVWRETERKSDFHGLTLWVFSAPQWHAYDTLRGDFLTENRFGFRVELVPSRAMDARLSVLFMRGRPSPDSPDAVEIETTSLGRYLRPNSSDIGFLPLNRYLEAGGKERRWVDRILASRLAPATKHGEIFAVPHDVHPVALAYRDDLFREAGVPLTDAAGQSLVQTWAQLQEKCIVFQKYWRARGYPTRHAMQLPAAHADVLLPMLMQQHLELIDAAGAIHLNDPKVAQTMAAYVGMVAGPQRIGDDAGANSAMEYADLAEGNFCALLMPDWKLGFVKEFAPGLAGKLRLIPLPRFQPDDEPTASYGGTFIAIPRTSEHPDQAWKLIEFLYFSPQSLERRRELGILPPLPDQWSAPEYQQPDPFLGGQKGLRLYAQLARHVPPVSSSPVNSLAAGTLNYVLSLAVNQARTEGSEHLAEKCQQWLDAAAADLQRRIDQARVSDP